MTALNMAKHRNNPNFAFWKMIKEGYDDFEATHQEPKVAVCEKRYVFDAVPAANASKPLSFNARGKCPVFQLDPAIASVVLDHRRQEQIQMAQYIARDVSLAPSHAGIDGGMNPVFVAKLGTQAGFDGGAPTYQVADYSHAPGALPGTATPPAAAASQPATMASVPMPEAAPQPKEGVAPPEEPKSIAGLLGNLFGGSSQTASSEPATVGLRAHNTGHAAKPKRVRTVRTAPAPAASHARHHEIASAKPKTVTNHAATAAERPTRKAQAPAAPAPEVRTAYSASPENKRSTLSGAQPVVPAGSFESRWTALR
jgi:hypothetical protein